MLGAAGAANIKTPWTLPSQNLSLIRAGLGDNYQWGRSGNAQAHLGWATIPGLLSPFPSLSSPSVSKPVRVRCLVTDLNLL